MPKRTSGQPDPVTAYATSVLKGQIVTNRLVKLACRRHRRDLREQKKRHIEWHPIQAQHAIDFFRSTLLLDSGKPFILEPFQEFIVGSVFGWFNRAGYRRFRTAYVEIGKGGGKSPLAAGIGLYGLMCDAQAEPGAEIYSAAVTRDQASIVFKDAAAMVTKSAELRSLIERNVGSLIVHQTGSSFKTVSSEHRSLDGKRVHMALIDEIHEHPHALVVDKMRAGTKTRRDALIFEITNSGYDRKSVCWDHHQYSVKILEQTETNEQWFAFVCGLDEKDDWKKEKTWPKANPGLDTILPREYLQEQVQEALGMPSKESIVKRLNFCIWTQRAIDWVDMTRWQKCKPPRTLAQLVGKRCFAGLDLASTTDITAYVLLFPDEDADAFDVIPYFWIPEALLEIGNNKHAERERLNLIEWASKGFISVTPGDTVDYEFIEKRVLASMETYLVRGIAYDRYNATQTVTQLQKQNAPLVKFGQGLLDMSAPSKQFERFVKNRAIRHGGNPVLQWMASNTSVYQDAAGNIKPDKETSGEKIDGIIATIMALGLWINPQTEEEKPSIYETRDPRFFRFKREDALEDDAIN